MRRRRAARSLLLFSLAVGVATATSGCGFFFESDSISVGSFRQGYLRRGRALPQRGDGWLVPPLWQARGNHFGTDELVDAIERAATRVRHEYPGGTLGVGDLSQRGGGDSKFHASHENGRDADLIYYAVDDKGKPVAPVDSMPRYDAVQLDAHAPAPSSEVRYGPFSPRRFDVVRNWALVRALLEDPGIEIQYLFIYEGLKQRLLAYARSIAEDPALVERADALLHQPGDSLPHDDHLHVRIYCSSLDRAWGCVDRGPVRWWKKRYKYMPPTTHALELGVALARLYFAPFLSGVRAFIP